MQSFAATAYNKNQPPAAAFLPETMSNMLEDERFDGMLLNFAQQCQGIEPLLDTFSYSTRTRACASTSSTPSDHLEPLQNTHSYPMRTRAHAGLSKTPSRHS